MCLGGSRSSLGSPGRDGMEVLPTGVVSLERPLIFGEVAELPHSNGWFVFQTLTLT